MEEKDAQPTERTAALWGLSNKIDSRIWVNFTKNGLGLGSMHQEPPHTDVSRNVATVVVREVIPGLRRRRTGLLWSKVLFLDESKFCISFRNQGPRVWRKGGAHSLSCLKSSVKFPQFVMIWGAMSSSGVGPLCFLKTKVTAPVYQDILEQFMLPSADQLFKDVDFIFQKDFDTCPHCQKHQKLVKWPWCWSVWLASKLTRYWGIVKRKMRNKRPKNADELKATVKESWASIPPQQCHKLITSMPRRIEAVIKTKGAPAQYWVHIQ